MFRNRQKQRAIDFQLLFASEVGKRVLHELMDAGGVLAVSHTANDPYETAFQEGRRSLVLWILTQLRVDPASLEKLIDEREDLE